MRVEGRLIVSQQPANTLHNDPRHLSYCVHVSGARFIGEFLHVTEKRPQAVSLDQYACVFSPRMTSHNRVARIAEDFELLTASHRAFGWPQ